MLALQSLAVVKGEQHCNTWVDKTQLSTVHMISSRQLIEIYFHSYVHFFVFVVYVFKFIIIFFGIQAMHMMFVSILG